MRERLWLEVKRRGTCGAKTRGAAKPGTPIENETRGVAFRLKLYYMASKYCLSGMIAVIAAHVKRKLFLVSPPPAKTGA